MTNPGFYHIAHLCPRSDGRMSSCGFSIMLWPAWKQAVAKSDITQEGMDNIIERMARFWLDGCGYARMYDPDMSSMERWKFEKMGKEPKLGPKARHLYDLRNIRVTWGPWGPEHLTVPGDACGLDISDGIGRPPGGMILQPHNVDNRDQVLLLLVVFTHIAELLIYDSLTV